MSTIHDVAKEAGVSTATVSRVLHNSNAVTPKTRDVVLSAIRRLNYNPNALARQMRTQKTHSIIVTVPDIGNIFFTEVIYGIEECAKKHGYQVLLVDVHEQSEIENYYFKAIQQHTIDGIISLSATVAKNLMEKVAQNYPIVVACQYLENYNVPNVTIDNIRAAQAVTEHLISLGHTKIAHISGQPGELLYQNRLNGYLTAIAAHGLPIDLSLVKYGDATIQGGYNNMNHLLEQDSSITAVFAAGDAIAIGAVKALHEAGIRIPEDFSIIGFDDIDLSAFLSPALTTIRQPRREIGNTAFEMLLRLMNQEPLEQMQVVLDYELITRDSCGPCRAK